MFVFTEFPFLNYFHTTSLVLSVWGGSIESSEFAVLYIFSLSISMLSRAQAHKRELRIWSFWQPTKIELNNSQPCFLLPLISARSTKCLFSHAASRDFHNVFTGPKPWQRAFIWILNASKSDIKMKYLQINSSMDLSFTSIASASNFSPLSALAFYSSRHRVSLYFWHRIRRFSRRMWLM